MSPPILCKRCGQRRAKRACPALHADICSICCGEEREVSISCPLDCEHLRQAHLRESEVAATDGEKPHKDIEVDEEFLVGHEELLLFSIYSLWSAAVRTGGAVDSDVMEAVEALIQTYRTAESGLIYETRPGNVVAAGVQRLFQDSLEEYREVLEEREAQIEPLRDKDVLRILVFLLRFGYVNRNGRPKGRLFIDMLKRMTPTEQVEKQRPSIIL